MNWIPSRQRLKSLSVTDQTRPAFLPQLGVNTLEFAYDDAGNRIKKSVSGGESTYYINSGLTVLNELDARGEVSKTIVQGLSQIAEIDAQGRISFIHSDALDSAVFVSDEAGAVVQQYDYDPFGTVIGAFGSANTRGTKYQFTGQEFDGESNLSYFNARYLSSTTGRFIARDTYLGTDGNLLSRNRYTYVQNNPLKYVDPTGNEKKAKQAEDNGSTEVVHAAMAEQPQMHFAGWKDDALSTLNGMQQDVNTIGDFLTYGQFSQTFENVGAASQNLGKKIYQGNPTTGDFVDVGWQVVSGTAKTAGTAYANGVMLAELKLMIPGKVGNTKAVQPMLYRNKPLNITNTDKNITVLGKYDDYINLASDLGARRFNIPTNVWNKMSANEQWIANQKFLDRTIARGDKIILSNRVTDISKVTGMFRKELEYLIRKGYVFSNNGKQLTK